MNPELLKAMVGNPEALLLAIDRELSERSLYEYLRRAWPAFDPARFTPGWHLEAIAEHLEAVVNGEIRRLLINISPRASKTSIVSIAFPTWVWAQKPDLNCPLKGPGAQFLCVAYGSDKAEEDGVTARRLIASDWYQQRWGDRYSITKDRDNQQRYDTSAGGSRISVGIEASVLGRGGNIKIIDDAMKPDDPESSMKRQSVIKAYDETLSSRENDPRIAAEIVMAQRLAEDDLPGHILSKFGSDPDRGGFVHLSIPAEYEYDRHCVTVIGWEDPRGVDDETGETLPDEERRKRDGMSFWPDRFSPEVLKQRKKAEGKFSYSAKYQQAPVPRGGGIIKPEWWQVWPPQGEEFLPNGKPKRPLAYPPFDYIVGYLDTALTSKQENDPSGMCVYGSWRNSEGRQQRTRTLPGGGRDEIDELYESGPRIMLMDAWTGHLEFNALLRRVIQMARKWKIHRLVIEAKTAGHSVQQELARLLQGELFGITLDNPRGDKDARLSSVSHLFEAGLVWRPERDWAQRVVDQCSAGSKGAHDEMADCTAGALRYLRKLGEAVTVREHDRQVQQDFGVQTSVELYDV